MNTRLPGLSLLVFLALSSFSLTGCETMGNTYEGMKKTVSSIGVPDMLRLSRDDKEEDAAPATRENKPKIVMAPRENAPAIASSSVVSDPEAAYNADMAALGLDDGTNATLEKADDNTYVFREKKEVMTPEAVAAAPLCPDVSLVRELKSLHQFTDPADPMGGNKISDIAFTDVKSKCQIKENNLIVDIELSVKGTLGPKGRTGPADRPAFSYPYFLAITSMEGNIIAKDIYAFTASYGADRNIFYGQDTIRQIMPMPERGTPADISLLIGFQLTPEELAYNRTLSAIDMPDLDLSAPNSPEMKQIEPAAGDQPEAAAAPAGMDTIPPVAEEPAMNNEPIDITAQ